MVSSESSVSLPVCMLAKSRLGDFTTDCAERLRRANILTAEERAYLTKAEVEGERERRRIMEVLDGSKPVVLQGVLNSAPGRECEFVRWLIHHRFPPIRALAQARVQDVCSSTF